MKIIFVRHGHPNYKDDCLTELGHSQAKAAAERLKNEKIDKIFSSTCGRAVETAQHIAARHNMDVHQLEFMREIRWGTPGTDDFVHPWTLATEWVRDDKDIVNLDWKEHVDFKGHEVVDSYNTVSAAFDCWLKDFGYQREGKYYRVLKENNDTIMMVSHGGSSSVALSHIFNLPFSFVCWTICPDFTAITVVDFCGKEGELTTPQFKLVNDAHHIEGITAENYFGR
ncbi:MAG: histidine phosphatase family protein [Clostridia bacterium]|nr:histidine phosphatase family protein [Clostridia bacterium]